jgi:hypothetical protein
LTRIGGINLGVAVTAPAYKTSILIDVAEIEFRVASRCTVEAVFGTGVICMLADSSGAKVKTIAEDAVIAVTIVLTRVAGILPPWVDDLRCARTCQDSSSQHEAPPSERIAEIREHVAIRHSRIFSTL